MTANLDAAGAKSAGWPTLRALGWVALAIALYVVLVDAALETVLSGSHLRWIVAGTVAVYAAATAVSWRPTAWPFRAGASVLVLLALLLVTAWLPDGTTRGITLAGQATSTVFTLASAAAVLMTGIALIRSAYLPAIARGMLGALAAYGVLALLSAMATGTTYPALFHGGGPWSRLPFWLQGAFLGSLILAPAAVLLWFGEGLLRSPAAPFHGRGVQVLVMGTGLLIALGGLRAPAGPAALHLMLDDRPAPVRAGPMVFARGESGGEPVGAAARFGRDVKTVYMFLTIEGVKGGDTVGAVWSRGAETVFRQQVTVTQVVGAIPSGKERLWFTLQFPDGAPPGGYVVEVTINGRLAQWGSFAIDPKR